MLGLFLFPLFLKVLEVIVLRGVGAHSVAMARNKVLGMIVLRGVVAQTTLTKLGHDQKRVF
jgi:hypothetical protein